MASTGMYIPNCLHIIIAKIFSNTFWLAYQFSKSKEKLTYKIIPATRLRGCSIFLTHWHQVHILSITVLFCYFHLYTDWLQKYLVNKKSISRPIRLQLFAPPLLTYWKKNTSIGFTNIINVFILLIIIIIILRFFKSSLLLLSAITIFIKIRTFITKTSKNGRNRCG